MMIENLKLFRNDSMIFFLDRLFTFSFDGHFVQDVTQSAQNIANICTTTNLKTHTCEFESAHNYTMNHIDENVMELINKRRKHGTGINIQISDAHTLSAMATRRVNDLRI